MIILAVGASPSFSQLGWSEFCKTSSIATTDCRSTFDQDFGHAMDYTAYLHLSSFGDGNINCNNVTNNNIVSVNNVIADENPEIMQWLSPLDPRGRHQDVRMDRLDGVGSWLLGTKEFREWRSNEGGADKGVLFCHGDPGVGKTYLRQVLASGVGRNHR